MYKFNFKNKIPQKISKWYLVKFTLYSITLIVIIILIINKLNTFN